MPRTQRNTDHAPLATVSDDKSTLPDDVSNEVIDQAVRDLNRLYDRAGLEAALAAGKLVVDRFYAGDLQLARDTNPNKHVSFRKLASHPDLMISATILHRHVSIYEMCERLGVSPGKHLGVSHLREVIGLSEKEQKRLLAKAEEQGWSRRQLEDAARKVRKKLHAGKGRRPLPGFREGNSFFGEILRRGKRPVLGSRRGTLGWPR